MISNNRILVIIPAWNEAESVAGVIREVATELPGVGLLVVDDGSADATAAAARGAGALVLRLPYHLGVGGAMRLGYRYARDHGYDVAIQVDADGQHDPRFVPQLVAALEKADMVIGARFAGVGNYPVKGPRRYAMILLARALSRATRSPLSDVTSGFRAVNRRVIEIFARSYPVEYLGDTVETVMHLARLRLRVIQVPVAMRPRMAGTPSQTPARAALYLARAVVVLGLALVRRYEPEPTLAPVNPTVSRMADPQSSTP
ncbi:glycosyltransferase family 2 protein [Micromonospora inositola]|uniref:Glycosyl transferase family 2 n=1 Tax=Micromonospora inositola TaxID=47865 RepID=A0A1C5GYH1_9ACTN|nr:glycosyltransferase family 2 protein [Micromonospora inositola]SCG38836.1 Glycosyl transferase family 2 [Micromonospora inositola]